MTPACVVIFAVVAFSLFGAPVARALPWPQQSAAAASAGDELNEGVDAYKTAHYDEAVAHFRKAHELAPDNPMATIYLATALAQNVVPGLDTPDNLKAAQQSIEMFQQVLAAQPHDINSMKQVAGIYFSIKNLDEARAWQIKILNEDPADPEAAYTIGVIDWSVAHQNAQKILVPAGLNDDGEGNSAAPVRLLSRIRSENADLVDEGLRYLRQAITNRPKYDDAMAYMNLMYRRKADLDFDNHKARDEDVAMAREWANKAMAARKANVEEEMRKPVAAPQ